MRASCVVTASLGLLNLESVEAEESGPLLSPRAGGQEGGSGGRGPGGVCPPGTPAPVPASPRTSQSRAFGGPRGAWVWAQGPVWPGGLAPAPSQPQLCLLPGSASLSPGRIQSRLGAPSARQGAMPSLAGSTGLCSSALGPITETGQAGCPVLGLLQGGFWLGVSRP